MCTGAGWTFSSRVEDRTPEELGCACCVPGVSPGATGGPGERGASEVSSRLEACLSGNALTEGVLGV